MTRNRQSTDVCRVRVRVIKCSAAPLLILRSVRHKNLSNSQLENQIKELKNDFAHEGQAKLGITKAHFPVYEEQSVVHMQKEREQIVNTTLMRREKFLRTRFPHLLTDANGCATLRRQAAYLNLAISRSTTSRICFYVRGTPKIGNTFITFTRTQTHKLHWVLTSQVAAVLRRWQEIAPVGSNAQESVKAQRISKSPPRWIQMHEHPSRWSEKALAHLIEMSSTTTLSHRQMAQMLNEQNHSYVEEGCRPFTDRDVANRLRKLMMATESNPPRKKCRRDNSAASAKIGKGRA